MTCAWLFCVNIYSRSSRSSMLYKIGVLKSFARFTGKRHCAGVFFKIHLKVEKTEIFREDWKFANWTYFASCVMRKRYFLLWIKETAFFPYFYYGIIFYSTELFDCAVNFKFYLNIFIFLNITQIKHQRSNLWIKKEPLITGSAVERGFAEVVAQMCSLKKM